jgi:molybdate transport system ATP-binding protein
VQSGPPRKILDQPANLEVARLLGAFNLLPGEIRALDPSRNTSKIRVGEFDLDGPYFPGKLLGDRVTLCVRPAQLSTTARNGRPGPNQIPTELKRALETPHGMRLEFDNGVLVDLARADYDRLRDTKEWVIQFPSTSLRIL